MGLLVTMNIYGMQFILPIFAFGKWFIYVCNLRKKKIFVLDFFSPKSTKVHRENVHNMVCKLLICIVIIVSNLLYRDLFSNNVSHYSFYDPK